ncbi:hypothetical protein NBRC113063_00799 [Apilactobacillus micheneri]|nr:hypothetical protein NBRC113063_00799 [Apilactobacillus micheneri]
MQIWIEIGLSLANVLVQELIKAFSYDSEK